MTIEKHENIHEAQINSIITFKVKVIEHKPSKFRKQPYKIHGICGNTPVDIVFFNARHPVIKASLPVDSERFISGKLEYFRNTFLVIITLITIESIILIKINNSLKKHD